MPSFDGDPASNTLSWRWVAGLHTKGKSYLAQADNITKYSEGRWTPKAEDLAQRASVIADDGAGVSHAVVQREYPPLPEGVFGVITTNEDLSVEQIAGLVRNDTNVALLADRADRGVSDNVADFIDQAESDLMMRLGERGSIVNDPHSVVEWATSRKLSQVVIVAPMVGSHSTLAEDVSRALIENGVSVVWYQREWDRQLHRLADRGFFPFWEWVKKSSHALF